MHLASVAARHETNVVLLLLESCRFVSETTSDEDDRSLFVKSKHHLITLNLFPSLPTSTTESDLRDERISTRLFIILLIASTSIIVGYTALMDVVKVEEIDAPTLAQYSHLYSKYPQTLICPCKKIIINYEKFLRVNYTLHQLCHSDFVGDGWITYLAQYHAESILFTESFQWLATYIFQSLRLFCQSSDRALSESLNRFYASDYVALTVTSKALFQAQSKLLMEQYSSSTTNDFLLSLEIIRDITQANSLYAAAGGQYFLFKDSTTQKTVSGLIGYDNCKCSSSAKCSKPASIYDNDKHIYTFEVPGMYSACFEIEALLQSTLECFYNRTCIKTLQSYISSAAINVSSLDASLPSRFQPNSTIEDLIHVLMVENWTLTSAYENYYNECKPINCVYTYVGKNDMTNIVTTVLGLIGGLITVLRFLVPRFVKFTPELFRSIRRYLRLSRLETGKHLQSLLISMWRVSKLDRLQLIDIRTKTRQTPIEVEKIKDTHMTYPWKCVSCWSGRSTDLCN